MSNYFELVESFEKTTGQIRSAGPEHFERASNELMERAIAGLVPLGAESFEKVMIWQADKLYRVLNHVEMLDRASFVFLSAIGAAFGAIARQRGRAIAYVVDNVVPYDRLRGIHAAFNALGFVVASPELTALELGEHDGLQAEDVLAKHVERYREEATAVALRLVTQTIEQRRCLLWLSGESGADVLRAVASAIASLPYVGVFRNDAPVDGTNVQVFQATGVQDTLAI